MKSSTLFTLVLSLSVVASLQFFTGCATKEVHSERTASSPSAAKRSALPPSDRERPGIATKWGEDRTSRVNSAEFSRGGKTRPYSTGKIYYNDREGASAMASHRSHFARRSRSSAVVAGGTLEMSLKDSSGRTLESYQAMGNRYFVGEDGDRYTIYFRNKTDRYVEVVASVDGLDVLDGKSASVKKSGYRIQPKGTLKIDGFRRSNSTVAAFRFGRVNESYAEKKHGDSSNVGVVGVAVYIEHGWNPWNSRGSDTHKRNQADPFPNGTTYATPPRW